MLCGRRRRRKNDRRLSRTVWSKYEVSYSQVYQWVRHYEEQGEGGLEDRRGKRKSDEEVDELERLRRENLRLKAKLQESERLNLLLKKVKEFEGS